MGIAQQILVVLGCLLMGVAAIVAICVVVATVRARPKLPNESTAVLPEPPPDDLVFCFETIRSRVHSDDATIAALIVIREGISEVLMPMPSDQELQL